jgi:hypothetical protein
MRKPAKKNVAEGRGHACRSFGELTCSEGQVEEMLSAGESTEQEHMCPNPSEQKALPAEKEI